MPEGTVRIFADTGALFDVLGWEGMQIYQVLNKH